MKAVAARVGRGDDPWGPLRGRSLTKAGAALSKLRPEAGD
jgi:hypothetical protein